MLNYTSQCKTCDPQVEPFLNKLAVLGLVGSNKKVLVFYLNNI